MSFSLPLTILASVAPATLEATSSFNVEGLITALAFILILGAVTTLLF